MRTYKLIMRGAVNMGAPKNPYEKRAARRRRGRSAPKSGRNITHQIHWKMPLKVHDDFRGVDFWCAIFCPCQATPVCRWTRQSGEGSSGASIDQNFRTAFFLTAHDSRHVIISSKSMFKVSIYIYIYIYTHTYVQAVRIDLRISAFQRRVMRRSNRGLGLSIIT